jgi:hypothetical protein
MYRSPLLLALAALLLLLTSPNAAGAQGSAPPLTVSDRGTFVVFPDRISFNAQIRSRAPVTQVVLEYGVVKRTCGDITAKAFPKFRPGTALDVNWTWEMLQTGSEPPGAVIWYRWRVTDRDGNTAVTPDAHVTWLDTTYEWQQLVKDDLTLHWYDGSRAFASDLLNTMVGGVEQLASMTGVRPQAPIHLYVYGDTAEMQDAILYEPSWTGGAAFPANNITIIGIHPANLEWGKRTVVHELTHLIVGQMTFSCGENVPTWLNEGIAVYAEGGLDGWSEARFRQAVAENSLLSVRDLTNGFSAHPDLADLSYSQSYSLVAYLVERHGPERLLALFERLRAGASVEAGLQQAYGLGLDALEDGWRGWVGAGPRPQAASAAPPEPTPIPTYAPLGAAPTSAVRPPARTTAPTATATLAPTAEAMATATLEAGEPAGGVVDAQPPASRGSDPRAISAALLFLVGLCLAGTASWKLFGGRS